MKTRLRKVPFLRDDQAQALTEFVIVIPVLLLVFFAALQTMVIAQSAQLVNYAAYVGARSYATSHGAFRAQGSKNPHEDAKNRAERAVALVMAPVSHAQFGEALFLFNPLRSFFAGMPEVIDQLYSIAEGYVVAYVWRIKGFDISHPSLGPDNPKSTIRCTFDYMQPLSIPGLAEIWNFLYVRGGYDIGTFEQQFEMGAPFVDSAAMSRRLNAAQDALVDLGVFFSKLSSSGFPGTDRFAGIADVTKDINLAINHIRVGVFGSLPILGAPNNIRIHGHSIMGFEPWREVRVTGGHGGRISGESEFDDCLNELEQREEAYKNQEHRTQSARDARDHAQVVRDQRRVELNACRQNPPQDGCGPQEQAYNQAQRVLQQREEALENEGDRLADMNDAMSRFRCP